MKRNPRQGKHQDIMEYMELAFYIELNRALAHLSLLECTFGMERKDERLKLNRCSGAVLVLKALLQPTGNKMIC